MKAGWQKTTLAEVLQNTETVDPLKAPDSEFEYIDVSSVSNKTFRVESTQRLKGKDAPSRARRNVKANDVLFATVRPTLRRIAIVPKSLDNQICSTGYFVLRPRPLLDYRFIFYFLFTEDFNSRMEQLQKGASYPAVTDSDVRTQPFPLPPLPEQRRIVGILDKAFAAIATAKANAEKNLLNARALFDSQLENVFIERGAGWNRETLQTLLDNGWIEDHLDGNHGSDYPRKQEFITDGVPYISANCIDNDSVDLTRAKYLSPARAAQIRKGVAKDRDVLFAHNATVGPVSILRTDRPKVILGTSLTYYRCNTDHILPEYLAHYMRSAGFRSQYEAVMRQSTRNQVPITKQREFHHVIPPISEQQEIVWQLDHLLAGSQRLACVYNERLSTQESLKKSILAQAFTGQL